MLSIKNQLKVALCKNNWLNITEKTKPGADCGSDHEFLIAKFRLKLREVEKTTRPFRYDLNQIPYYIWHLMHHTQRHIHSLSSHLIVITTLYPLHSWHTMYDNTHMTTQKLYLPSHPLYLTLHPLYLWHQTQCINCITPTLCMTLHTLCMTSHSVCMTSHEHFMTSHWYRYDITSSISMTSYPIYMISPLLFHEN